MAPPVVGGIYGGIAIRSPHALVNAVIDIVEIDMDRIATENIPKTDTTRTASSYGVSSNEHVVEVLLGGCSNEYAVSIAVVNLVIYYLVV